MDRIPMKFQEDFDMDGLDVPGAIDELDHLDLVRRQGEAERNREQPLVNVNPAEARNGSLGGEQAVTGGGRTITVVDFRTDDVKTLPMVVTLLPVIGLGATGLAEFGGSFRPFARVRWGTKAAPSEAVVDVGRGCQFTVAGSFCTVDIGADAAGVVPEITANIAAMLSFWTTARQQPVYRTSYIDDLGAGATSSVRSIPAFASSAFVCRTTAAGNMAPVRMNFIDNAGTLRYTFDLTAGSLQPLVWPVAGDVTQFTVANSGGDPIQVRVVWALCL